MSEKTMFGEDAWGLLAMTMPEPAGTWVICESLRIDVMGQPTEAHIKAHEELLGWKWEPNPKYKLGG